MPLKYSQLSPGQRAMVDDGCPIAAMPSAKEHAAYLKWRAANPPTVVRFAQVETTRNEDADTTAFRAAEDERRRQKSLAGIAKMKARLAAKASKVDYSKMRWDPRKSKFVPDIGSKPVAALDSVKDWVRPVAPKFNFPPKDSGLSPEADTTIARISRNVSVNNARAMAVLNDVWDDKYNKLTGGLLTMTVANRLKGLVKRGGEVRWN